MYPVVTLGFEGIVKDRLHSGPDELEKAMESWGAEGSVYSRGEIQYFRVCSTEQGTKKFIWEKIEKKINFQNLFRDFPDGPVLRLHTSSAGGVGLISGQGTKIPHAL